MHSSCPTPVRPRRCSPLPDTLPRTQHITEFHRLRRQPRDEPELHSEKVCDAANPSGSLLAARPCAVRHWLTPSSPFCFRVDLGINLWAVQQTGAQTLHSAAPLFRRHSRRRVALVARFALSNRPVGPRLTEKESPRTSGRHGRHKLHTATALCRCWVLSMASNTPQAQMCTLHVHARAPNRSSWPSISSNREYLACLIVTCAARHLLFSDQATQCTAQLCCCPT